MKKSLKSAGSILLAASMMLCIGQAAVAEEAAQTADAVEYGVVGATVMVPADWEYEKYAGAYTLIGPALGEYMAIAVKEYAGSKIDFNDPESIEAMLATAGADEGEITTYDITVCGQPAIWTTAELTDEDDEKMVTYVVIADMPGSGLMVTYSAFGDVDPTLFASAIMSIKMDDCEGETDITAAFDGETVTYNPIDSVSAEYRSQLGKRK